MNKVQFKSRKDASKFLTEKGIDTSNWTEIQWLKLNKGQAEIHMMALAECIWDAVNESKSKQLQSGQWHIPFRDKIDRDSLRQYHSESMSWGLRTWEDSKLEPGKKIVETIIKISTAMAARTSYTVVGDEKEIGYYKLLEIYERLITARPLHASPMEHCSRAMSQREWEMYFKGKAARVHQGGSLGIYREDTSTAGWCRNFKGFIQLRHLLETGGIL